MELKQEQKDKLRGILQEVCDDVLNAEFRIFDNKVVIRDSVTQEDDVFPSELNAVFSLKGVMDSMTDKDGRCLWEDELEELDSLKDSLVKIDAKVDGSDTAIYGYSDGAVYVLSLGVLEQVSRDGFEFKELD